MVKNFYIALLIIFCSFLSSKSTYLYLRLFEDKFISQKLIYPFSKNLDRAARLSKKVIMDNLVKNNQNTSEEVDPEILNLKSAWHDLLITTHEGKNFLSHGCREGDNNPDEFCYRNKKYTWGIPGGYIDSVSDKRIIGSDGVGNIFSFNLKTIKFQKIRSNLNVIYNNQNFKGKYIENLQGRFGVRDIFYDKKEKFILASMFIDVDKNACYGIAIYKAKYDLNENYSIEDLKFNQFFITKKCNKNFNGHASGGRIKKLGENYILTVGDLDHNLSGNRSIPQSSSNTIGKVISISPDGSNYKIISKGHRNQQGLEIVGADIFITEHGPKGGDEINLVKDSQHYGWPYYVYGFGYDDKVKFRFPHENNFKKPIFYFTPSIGISEIVFYDKEEFPFWKNKFIVSSLIGRSLFILDYDAEKKKIISSEKITIGSRIRDLNLTNDGQILIVTDDQKLLILSRDGVDHSKNNRDLIPF
ncbi:MAG: hypothetical protein CBC84_000120 [Pelagibacteraceae bacterium TMED124]|nr:MAG: hypothetical protein CBC84_000120 [Pelagibacteraceae bacterium TMED124]|tara:strand:+ start:4616 stop:6031 length:1416 start_codon:yes stop_codon:yes gene_type:complete